MQCGNLVRYWWTFDGEEEICERTEVVILEEMECYHCLRKQEAGSKMSKLHSVEDNQNYYVCVECADENTCGEENGK